MVVVDSTCLNSQLDMNEGNALKSVGCASSSIRVVVAAMKGLLVFEEAWPGLQTNAINSVVVSHETAVEKNE